MLVMTTSAWAGLGLLAVSLVLFLLAAPRCPGVAADGRADPELRHPNDTMRRVLFAMAWITAAIGLPVLVAGLLLGLAGTHASFY